MTKAAFLCWKDRIAPVFDTACEFHAVEVQSGKIVRESRETLEENQPLRTALRFAELQTDVLVCGAVSGYVQSLIAAYGIRVVPFVSGDLRPVIDAWVAGKLKNDAFAMPGCGRHLRQHCGRGSGGGRGRRFRRG
jgi:predicted Fe-Mo cluster-binding NifX family protein